MSVTAVRTEGLTKHFGDVVALDHLDLEVAQGEVVGYLGPMGRARRRRSACCSG
jgi:ABC-2 type transport system ATP-binding protein